jgi:DNA-directed RNA polymerase subunit RPC12/RpoP
VTSPPRQVEVVCPACGHEYETWHRRSINLTLGQGWTEEEIREATSARCPECGHEVEFRTLIVDTDRSS